MKLKDKIQILYQGPRTYADKKALLDGWKQAGHVDTKIVQVNNGNTEKKDLQKNKIASISCDKKEIVPDELVTYTVKLDEKEKDKVKTEINQVKFCLWFQYKDEKGTQKKLEIDTKITPAGVILVSKRNADPRVTSIFEPREDKRETLTGNLDSAYYYASISYTENEAKLEIKYSKWMDSCRIRVEAYFSKILQDGLKTTASRWVKAKPEVLDAYWMNAEGKKITQTGYDQEIYLYLKTLGLKNKEVTVNIYDWDYHPIANAPRTFPLYHDKTGNDLVEWKNNQIKIDNKGEAIKQFKVGNKLRYENAANDEKDNEHKKQIDELGSEFLVPMFDFTEKYKDLELYVHIPPSKDLKIDPQNNFGQLILTEEQLISNAFFAEAEKKKKGKSKVQADAAPTKKSKNPKASVDQYVQIDKGALGQTVRLVAECPNLEGKKVAFKVFETKPLLGEKDKALTLIYEDKEKTRIETTVKNGYAVAEVKLQHCKEDADNEDWAKMLFPDTVKKKKDLVYSELFLKVEATKDLAPVGQGGEFLKDSPFKLTSYNCGCQKCINYQDVWTNPEISSAWSNKNKNRYVNVKRGKGYHKGVDIHTGATYKDIHSLLCGKVAYVKDSFITNKYQENSLGNVVTIKSNDKDGKVIYIMYCHLDKVHVKKGDKVIHGQKIALSGSTGNASDANEPNGN